MVIAAMKLKDAYSLEWNYDQPRQNIKKQKHYLINKSPSSQGYGFSSSHVWMRELDIQVFLESFAFPGCALSEVVLIPQVGGAGGEVTESSCIDEQGRPHGGFI